MAQGGLKLGVQPDQEEEEAPDEYGSLDLDEVDEDPNDWDPDNWGDHQNEPVTREYTRQVDTPAFVLVDPTATLRDGPDLDDTEDLLDISGYGEEDEETLSPIDQLLSTTAAIRPLVDYYNPEAPLPEDWTEVIITNIKNFPGPIIEELNKHPEIKIIRSGKMISILRQPPAAEESRDELDKIIHMLRGNRKGFPRIIPDIFSDLTLEADPESKARTQIYIKNFVNYIFFLNPNAEISVVRFNERAGS